MLLKVNSIPKLPRTGHSRRMSDPRRAPDTRDGCPTPHKRSMKAPFDLPRMSERLPPRDKMNPIRLGHPIHQPMKLSSTGYLAT